MKTGHEKRHEHDKKPYDVHKKTLCFYKQAKQANGDYYFTKCEVFQNLGDQQRTNLFSDGDIDERHESL